MFLSKSAGDQLPLKQVVNKHFRRVEITPEKQLQTERQWQAF